MKERATETSKSDRRVCLMCAEGELCVECERPRRGEVVRSWKDKSAMSSGPPRPIFE